MNTLKIYGERNTGTNYLSRLLHENLEFKELAATVPANRFWLHSEFTKNLYFTLTTQQNGGWKHACPKTEVAKKLAADKGVQFITISKNPYAFLRSLHKRPYHYKGDVPTDFKTFLTTPWRTQRRDNTAPILKSPIDLWNVKNQGYVNLKTAVENTVLLTYESVLKQPLDTVNTIKNHFGLVQKKDLRNYEQSTKNSDKSFDDYAGYYLNEKWRSEISEECFSIINDRLDAGLVEQYGYEIIVKP